MATIRILCGFLSLCACSIYTLPELDSAGSTAASETGATSEGSPTTGADTGPADGSCDFAGEVQPIFSEACGACHGAQTQAGLSLADGAAYAALVGVASTQVPGSARVEPGDPAASYLLQKLGPGPAVGGQMPLGGSLAADRIAIISAWIAAGAPETASFPCAAGEPTAEVGAVEIEASEPVLVPVGEIVQLDVIVTDLEGEPLPAAAVTWTSSGELTLFADGTGALLGVSPGTVQLTASAGGVDSSPVSVEVVAHVPPPASFAAVRAVTTARCAVAGCHVDGVEPGDLRFDRDDERLWEELLEVSTQVESLRRVLPGAPAESYLVHKLVQRSPAVGGQMPIGAAPIDAASAQVIVRWILADAPAN